MKKNNTDGKKKEEVSDLKCLIGFSIGWSDLLSILHEEQTKK